MSVLLFFHFVSKVGLALSHHVGGFVTLPLRYSLQQKMRVVMRSPLLAFSAVTLLCISLVGCQAPTRSGTASSVSSVTAADQLNQIASLVAASRYLKSQCNRSDFPDDGTLQRAALAVAQQKGWNAVNFTQLASRSENLYQGLLKDGTPKEAQCSEFNRSLAPFIDFIRKDFR